MINPTSFIVAAIIGLIIVACYKDAVKSANIKKVDEMWRLLIGIGAIPGVIALYFRLTIPETPRFRIDVERNVYQASEDVAEVLNKSQFSLNPGYTIHRIRVPKSSWDDFKHHFSQWKNLKVLIGTCYSWFALDVSTQVEYCTSLILLLLRLYIMALV
jgi:MFS transporter, PHS family, inorganic phosphate transporter